MDSVLGFKTTTESCSLPELNAMLDDACVQLQRILLMLGPNNSDPDVTYTYDNFELLDLITHMLVIIESSRSHLAQVRYSITTEASTQTGGYKEDTVRNIGSQAAQYHMVEEDSVCLLTRTSIADQEDETQNARSTCSQEKQNCKYSSSAHELDFIASSRSHLAQVCESITTEVSTQSECSEVDVYQADTKQINGPQAVQRQAINNLSSTGSIFVDLGEDTQNMCSVCNEEAQNDIDSTTYEVELHSQITTELEYFDSNHETSSEISPQTNLSYEGLVSPPTEPDHSDQDGRLDVWTSHSSSTDLYNQMQRLNENVDSVHEPSSETDPNISDLHVAPTQFTELDLSDQDGRQEVWTSHSSSTVLHNQMQRLYESENVDSVHEPSSETDPNISDLQVAPTQFTELDLSDQDGRLEVWTCHSSSTDLHNQMERLNESENVDSDRETEKTTPETDATNLDLVAAQDERVWTPHSSATLELDLHNEIPTLKESSIFERDRDELTPYDVSVQHNPEVGNQKSERDPATQSSCQFVSYSSAEDKHRKPKSRRTHIPQTITVRNLLSSQRSILSDRSMAMRDPLICDTSSLRTSPSASSTIGERKSTEYWIAKKHLELSRNRLTGVPEENQQKLEVIEKLGESETEKLGESETEKLGKSETKTLKVWENGQKEHPDVLHEDKRERKMIFIKNWWRAQYMSEIDLNDPDWRNKINPMHIVSDELIASRIEEYKRKIRGRLKNAESILLLESLLSDRYRRQVNEY